MCHVLNNFREYSICSVSEGLRSYFTTMKVCSESTRGVCDFGYFLASADVKASVV